MTDDHASAYDFVRLGNGLADTLLKAAEEQVTKAQAVLDQTKSLAEIIRNQVTAQAQQIEDMNARYKQFGEHMLDAHRMLNGSEPRSVERVQASPVSDFARLRALDALKRDRVGPASAGTIDPKRVNDPAYRAPDPNGYGKLPRAVAGGEQPVARNSQGPDRNDPPDDRAF